MGVAVSVRTSTSFFNCLIFSLCVTPNRCSSSTINRELRRGGQVYYVNNRVTDIADVALRIAKLVPDARVDFAHGQMSERELENVMYSFVNGDIDVLVSNTIIETGLDISNVNTMIIHDSD